MAADGSPGRKPEGHAQENKGAPVGATENSRCPRDPASVARFAGSIIFLGTITPGLRPGLLSAAVSDGLLS